MDTGTTGSAVAELAAVIAASLRAQAYVQQREGTPGLLVGGIVSPEEVAEAVLAAGWVKREGGDT